MIRVVFVRHGKKAAMPGRPDHDAPLGDGEPERLALMADAIDAKTMRPELWWSSHFDHCWQTARHLNRGANPVYRLSGLTPYSAEDGFTVQCMVAEASKLGAPMATVETLGIVGHEERLSKLAGAMVRQSGAAVNVLNPTEVLVISGDTWWSLYEGDGLVVERWSLASG
jgi:phosphohistidine phosphatase SixA